MAVLPSLPTDTVLYTVKDVFGDQDITIRMLDGSILNIWGTMFINGNPVGTVGVIPIATQAEAEAGTNNTNVMTPLRTSEHLAANVMAKLIAGSGGGTVNFLAANGTWIAPPSSGGGGGVTDGDKGDIVVSAGGATWQFDPSVVSVFIRLLLNDADAEEARATLQAASAVDLDNVFGIAMGAVQKTGDDMTGYLNILGASSDLYVEGHIYNNRVPFNTNDVTNKLYVDNADILRVLKAGDAMTGRLTIADANPNNVPLRLLSGAGGNASLYFRDAANAANNARLTAFDTGGVVLSSERTDQPVKILVNNLDKLVVTKDETQVANDPITALGVATKQYVDKWRQTVSTNSSTTQTYSQTSENVLHVLTAATAISLSIALNATIPIAVGTRWDYLQTGAGKLTVTAVGGVTLYATPSAVLRAQGSMASLIKIGTDTWVLTGDLT